MAEDLQIRIPVTLGMENVPEEVKKIQQQLSNNKNNAILINARLSDNVISNIQNQLKAITQQQYNINIGVGNTAVQSQLNQVNQVVTAQVNEINKKAVVAPKIDISQLDLENLKAMSNAFIKVFDIKSLTSEAKTELQSLMREFQVTTQKQDFSAIAKAQQALEKFAQDYGRAFKDSTAVTAFEDFKTKFQDINLAFTECDRATKDYLGTAKQIREVFGAGWNTLISGKGGVTDDSILWQLGSTLDEILINYRKTFLELKSTINETYTTIEQLGQIDVNKLFSSIANISGSSGLVNTAQQIQNIISEFTDLDGKLQITRDLFNQFTANGTNTSSLDSMLEKIGLSYTVVDNNAQNAIGTMTQFGNIYNSVATVQREYAENIKQSTDVENQNATATEKSTELAQKKLKAIEEITKAQEKQNKVVKSANNFRDYIDSSLMTFNGNENGINEAIQAFKKFGEVSSSSIKYPTMNAGGGYSDLIKYFTIEVKSATGELQKFAYTWKNIGDEDNPNFVYMLSNVREADSGVKKLADDMERAKVKAEQVFATFNNKTRNEFVGSDLEVYTKAQQALKTLQDNANYDNLNNFNKAMSELEAHYQKITSYTRSNEKSLNPFINAINDMAGMEEQIKRIKLSADGLQNKSKSLIGNLGSLNSMANNVNKYAIGTEEWAKAYEKLKNKIAQIKDQIKTLKLEQKSDNSFAQKQQSMYAFIEQRLKQINNLKKQQLSTDSETSKVIQEQIDSYQRQISSTNANMSKYGYKDSESDKRLENLKTELDYNLRIAESKAQQKANHQADTQMAKNIKQVNDYATAIEKSIDNLNKLKNNKIFTDNSNKSSVQAQTVQIDQFIAKLTQMRETVSTIATTGNATGKIDTNAFTTLVSDMTNLNSQIKTVETSAKDLQTQLKQTNGVDTQRGKIQVLVAQLEAFAVVNGKAMKSNKTLSSGMTVSQEWNAMMSKLKSGADNNDIQKITSQFKAMRSEVRALGLEGGTVFQNLWAAVKKFSSWMGITASVSRVTMKIRQAVTEIKELDNILTEISKTSDRTVQSLEKLGNSAFDTASKYGRTASDYLTGVQEMSRAGFNEQSSEQMAELSILAQSAGDMDTELANAYLIATNAAYKLNGSAEKLNDVLDRQNYVTNRNAVNLTELANATKIAGSQASTSSVGVDEMTAAVGTMIATTQEGGEVAGRAFKAIIMNLQQVSADADEIGDGGEAITSESLTKYEKACEALGVSLKEVRDGAIKLRDPMQVLEELANSVSKEADGSIKVANLINAVGGKYRGNQLISLLNNWDTYKKMLSEYNSNEAVGSALEEANKSAENLTGRLNALSNSFAKLVNSFADSSTMKVFVNGLNGIISAVNTLIDNFGALQTLIPMVFAGLSFKNIGVFKVIDGNLTSIFAKTKVVTSGFRLATNQVNTYIDTFNKINANQSFGKEWNDFLNETGNINGMLPTYFQEIAQQGASARASVEGFYVALLNGNTKGIANVRSVINAYNQVQQTGRTNSIAFANAVSQSNIQLGMYLTKLDGTKASMIKYNAILVATKARTIALKIVSMALNTAISIGITAGISALIGVISSEINKTQELIEKNKELSNSYNNNLKTLSDFKTTYLEIVNSTDSESEKTQRLIDWKKQLIEQYGLEEDALKKVNTERQTGISLINEEIYNQANTTISTLKGYDEALKKIYSANNIGHKADLKSKFWKDYHKTINLDDAKQFGLSEKITSGQRRASGNSDLIFQIEYETSNIYEQSEALKKALSYYKDIRDRGLDPDNQNSATITYLEDEYDRVQKIIDDYGETVSAGVSAYAQKYLYQFTQETEGKLANVIDKVTFETWKEKLLEMAGTSEPVKQALEKLANETFPNYSSNVIDSSNDTNNAVTAVTSLNDALTKLQELLKDIISGSSTYQSAMQKITAGIGLTAEEVNELLELDPSLFDKFIKQKDGTWTIDLEALRLSYDTIIVDGGKNAIAEEKKKFQEELDGSLADLERLQKERTEKAKNITGENDYRELSTLDKKIEEVKKNIQNAKDDLNIAEFNEKILDYSDADRIRDSYDDVVKKIDEYNDGISSLNKAIETINEGNSLSYDDMTKLVELYPELEGKVVETANGYIIEEKALEDVRTQSYKTRNGFIDDRTTEVQALQEDVKQQIEEYKRLAIARIVSENSHGNYVATVDELLENDPEYQALLLKLELYDEYFNKVVGYKRTVVDTDSSSKSADKSNSDALQNQIDYYTTLLDAITTVADKQIEALEKEKDAIDSKIDALEDEKDALKDKNDEQQRELDLIEAQNNLDKAKKQKVFVYKEGEGLVQVQDEKAVKDAQKELDDVNAEIEEAKIDKKIEALKKDQDKIDKQIDNINNYRDTFSDMESNAKDQLAIEQAKKALGVDENGLLNLDEKTIKSIRSGLAEAIYNKDVYDNKDNDKYMTVSLADYLSGLGATVTPQQFQAIANTATGNTPITAPVTNSTVNNAQSIVNNKSITLNNTFNVYDSKDSNTVIEQIKSYMNKTLRTAINSIK